MRSSPAADTLAAAEAADGYRAAIAASPLNAAARAKDRYVPSFLEPADAQRLEAEVHKIRLLDDTITLILDSSADAGYPHTRAPNIICLPAANAAATTSTASLAETLRHEAIHIHQRRNPDFWRAAAKADGWEPATSSQLPLDLLQRCRLNPDTFHTPFWSWDGRWIPLPLFQRDLQPTLGGVEISWWDLQREALYPSPPSPFSDRYGPKPSQPEHPYELLAVEAAAAGITTDADLRRKLGNQ